MENDVEYQLVPPHCHRHNAVERTIRSFKEHFVAGLASADLDLPLQVWDCLLPQAEMKLNLLRTSRQHLQVSAAAHFHGMIDYNKTAFASPGCKIIAHEKPSQRQTWATHGKHGYSLGPARHHYRCKNVYISSTASKRIVNTLEFSPHNFLMPQLSSMDRLLMAIHDMTGALKQPTPDVPFATIGDDTITSLDQLAAIFKNKFQKHLAPEISQAPIKAAENKQSAALIHTILSLPMTHNYQTGSHNQVSPAVPTNSIESQNSPQLPRVVTLAAMNATPSRVSTRAFNLSARNLSQDDFLDMDSVNQAIALGKKHWTNMPMANAVIHQITGKEMEYAALVKDPTL
jgi:hypothetical protein